MVGKRKFPDVGDPNDPKGFLALRERFLESLRVAHYSERSVETFGARLRMFFVWCDERSISRPEQVTRQHLERFQQWSFHYRKDDGNPLDVGTQKLLIGSLKLFFKYLAKHDYIPADPASLLEYPKTGFKLPKVVLNHQEVEQLFSQARVDTVIGLRDRAVLELLYSTALRRMELEGVRLEDLDQTKGTLTVRKGKGNKQRVVPVGERALKWVQKYLDEARPKLATDPAEQALFLDKDGKALSRRAITSLGAKVMRRAEMPKGGAVHVYRHSAATAMLEGGADVRFVQEMLGHASLLSTQIYTHVAIGKLKAVHAATHPGATLDKPKGGKDDDEKG